LVANKRNNPGKHKQKMSLFGGDWLAHRSDKMAGEIGPREVLEPEQILGTKEWHLFSLVRVWLSE
jgi:hypothetical protein